MNALTVLLITMFGLGSMAMRDVSAAETAFAANFNTGSRQIVRFPVGTPDPITVIGPLTDPFGGMDFDAGASTLWAVNGATRALGTLSTESGVFTPRVALPVEVRTNAFAIDPVNGTFYVAGGDNGVYTIDPVTGTAIFVGLGAPSGFQITELAVSCNGTLVAAGFSEGASMLYRTDLNSNPVQIGMLTFGSASGLDFDNRTGQLYGWFNTTGELFSWHGEVSLVNAQTTRASLIDGRYRMAIDNPCSVEQLLILRDGFEG